MVRVVVHPPAHPVDPQIPALWSNLAHKVPTAEDIALGCTVRAGNDERKDATPLPCVGEHGNASGWRVSIRLTGERLPNKQREVAHAQSLNQRNRIHSTDGSWRRARWTALTSMTPVISLSSSSTHTSCVACPALVDALNADHSISALPKKSKPFAQRPKAPADGLVCRQRAPQPARPPVRGPLSYPRQNGRVVCQWTWCSYSISPVVGTPLSQALWGLNSGHAHADPRLHERQSVTRGLSVIIVQGDSLPMPKKVFTRPPVGKDAFNGLVSNLPLVRDKDVLTTCKQRVDQPAVQPCVVQHEQCIRREQPMLDQLTHCRHRCRPRVAIEKHEIKGFVVHVTGMQRSGVLHDHNVLMIGPEWRLLPRHRIQIDSVHSAGGLLVHRRQECSS
eukprot:2689970-Prymnesium_polylepis.1